MTGLDIAAVVLGLSAVLAYVNFRTLRLPATVAMLLAGILGAVAITLVDRAAPRLGIGAHVEQLLQDVDFSSLLLNGMLGFLLFAGSLTIDVHELRKRLGTVATLASAGVIISTALVGTGTYYLFGIANLHVPFVYCLLFGALISPTDPIAVLALLNEFRAPTSVHVTVTSESLLNDGIGVVVYTALLSAAAAGAISTAFVIGIFLQEVIGGLALGTAGGFLVYLATRNIDEPHIEVQLSVALVTVLIALGAHLHVSGPLACVVAGLFIGHGARHGAMQHETTEALDRIWSFADHLMNAVLFLLLGLQAAVFQFASLGRIAVIAAIVFLVIAARFVSVAIPLTFTRRARSMPRGTIRILTWGGLRGGISVAMALGLPSFEHRQAILNVTYAVVVFSIIVQGLTIQHVIRHFSTRESSQ
jgi:CPA1 family monovalent cation:H+ antiporter